MVMLEFSLHRISFINLCSVSPGYNSCCLLLTPWVGETASLLCWHKHITLSFLSMDVIKCCLTVSQSVVPFFERKWWVEKGADVERVIYLSKSESESESVIRVMIQWVVRGFKVLTLCQACYITTGFRWDGFPDSCLIVCNVYRL